MSDAREIAAAVRRGVGVFQLEDRGLVEVTGGDRHRWLNGMVSNDVESLTTEAGSSGCYALRLDRKGRILADMHVWRREDSDRLEVAAGVVADLIGDLGRFIVADDVNLADRSADFDRLAVEGPQSMALVEAALGADPGLGHEAWCPAELGDTKVALGSFGFTGEAALQWLVPAGQGAAIRDELIEAGRAEGLAPVLGDAAALEIMRVEAGIPAWGSELGLDVFPDEARLGRAISTTKGCYTGQEIVARLRSRGQVNHLLVGLHFEGAVPAPAEADLLAGDRRTGEVTSSAISPTQGRIGLGYVRREHAEHGTELRWEGGAAIVVGLPIVDTGREAAGSRES